ncbi:unnamed protein product, partial [Urochloa humidicola]
AIRLPLPFAQTLALFSWLSTDPAAAATALRCPLRAATRLPFSCSRRGGEHRGVSRGFAVRHAAGAASWRLLHARAFASGGSGGGETGKPRGGCRARAFQHQGQHLAVSRGAATGTAKFAWYPGIDPRRMWPPSWTAASRVPTRRSSEGASTATASTSRSRSAPSRDVPLAKAWILVLEVDLILSLSPMIL